MPGIATSSSRPSVSTMWCSHDPVSLRSSSTVSFVAVSAEVTTDSRRFASFSVLPKLQPIATK